MEATEKTYLDRLTAIIGKKFLLPTWKNFKTSVSPTSILEEFQNDVN